MTKNDEVIKQLIVKVTTQKEALGSKPKVAWKTNGVFKFDDDVFFNINTVQSTKPLVNGLAYMIDKQKSIVEAAERLGVEVSDVDFGGYSITEWEEDFKLRLSIIKWEAKKKELNETQNKLSQLVSEEARTEMELEKISKSLE